MNAPSPTRDAVFTHTFASSVSSGRFLSADALRIAVKDLIAVAGTLTTAGSHAVERLAEPASADAPLLAGIRAAEVAGTARMVGKTNLHELAYGGDGMNPYFGTPPNPLDPNRVPGGSSSGSASAIGFDRADAAIGSDTGGSIRIPAACCGVVGLKTTWGLISNEAVWALAPTLDTIGPMAVDVDRLVSLMDCLQAGFAQRSATTAAADSVVVLSASFGQRCDPLIEEAVGSALRLAGISTVTIDAPWWQPAVDHGLTALVGEAYRTLAWLLDHEAYIEQRVAARIRLGAKITDSQLDAAHAFRPELVKAIVDACTVAPLIATPTLPMLPPTIDTQASYAPYTAYTRPANMAGTPAIAVPIPLVDAPPSLKHLRASIQLMGPPHSEALLVSTARRIEAAVRP